MAEEEAEKLETKTYHFYFVNLPYTTMYHVLHYHHSYYNFISAEEAFMFFYREFSHHESVVIATNMFH